jgi:hypothetical protein
MRISNNSVAMVEFIAQCANARADELLPRKVETAFAFRFLRQPAAR